MNSAVQDPRLMFRALMGTILAAVSFTITIVWPGTPPELVGLWGGVFLAAVGFAEVIFDRNSVQVPKDATAAEAKTILKEAN